MAPDEAAGATDAAALRGVWNIVPTPFTSGGELDLASVAPLIDLVVGSGVAGLTILGFMGEAHRLGDAERTAVTAACLDAVGGRLPVCVGVSHAATDRAVAFAREAAASGAHSVMLGPPALARPSDEPIVRHYQAVADAIEVPIVVQDYPAGSGVPMSVELLTTLARTIPRCRCVKLEDEPSPPKIARLRAAVPDLRILGGLGGIMLLEELDAGADGTMTGFGFPEILVQIVAQHAAGNRPAARDAFHRALPLIRFENQPGINLALRKHVYRRRGAIASERVRAPGSAIDPTTRGALDTILRDLGLADGLGPIEEPTGR